MPRVHISSVFSVVLGLMRAGKISILALKPDRIIKLMAKLANEEIDSVRFAQELEDLISENVVGEIDFSKFVDDDLEVIPGLVSQDMVRVRFLTLMLIAFCNKQITKSELLDGIEEEERQYADQKQPDVRRLIRRESKSDASHPRRSA